MSWIVTQILFDKERIRENGTVNSEELDSLIAIETTYEYLRKQKAITDSEDKIFWEVLSRKPLVEVAKTIGMNRDSLIDIFDRVTDRIAYCLGYYFTDTGYIEYVAYKYNLTQDQIELARDYMESRFRNKTLKDKYKVKENI